MDKHDPGDERDLSRLYAATPRDEPPAALDSAVLARARHEVAPPVVPPVAPKPWLRSLTWAPRFALAAVVVLSVSLVLTVEHEQPQPRPQTQQSFEEASSAPRAAPSEATDQMPRAGKASEPVPTAAQPRANDSPAYSTAPTAAEAERRDAAPGASVVHPAPAPAVPDPIAPPAPLAAPAAPPAYAPAPLAAPSPIAPTPMRPAERAKSQADSSSGSTAADARALAKENAAQESPEAWLKRLEELRKQGRMQEFRASLAEFRKRYPSYAIPQALTAPE